MNGIAQFPAGLRSGATFVAALVAAGLLEQFTHAPPIFVALVASLTVAGAAFAWKAQKPFDADYMCLSQAFAHVVSCLTALLGLCGIAVLAPAIGSFVCEPLVPRQFSIAIFGAFGMSWLAAAARLRIPYEWAGLAIHLAFFWIAPFYGFFHAPWFLAQSMALPCAGRPFAQVAVVVLSMIVAGIAGRQIAKWTMQ